MTTTIAIHTVRGHADTEAATVVAEKRMARHYGPGGDRFRCIYHAKIARTADGRLWLNHPTTPAYPEEASFDADDWAPADMFPKCVVGLAELVAKATGAQA